MYTIYHMTYIACSRLGESLGPDLQFLTMPLYKHTVGWPLLCLNSLKNVKDIFQLLKLSIYNGNYFKDGFLTGVHSNDCF